MTKIKYLLSLFADKYPNRFFMALVLGVFSGAAYACLIPLVMLSLNAFEPQLFSNEIATVVYIINKSPSINLGKLFLFLCLFILFTAILSKTVIERVRIDVESELRVGFYRRVSASPIQDLEKLGNERALMVLTKDIPEIAEAVMVIPSLLTQLATLIGLMLFLIYLSNNIFYFVLITLVVGVLAHTLPLLIGIRFLTRSRDAFSHLVMGMRGLIYGAKELKLNEQKRISFTADELTEKEKSIRHNQRLGVVSLAIAGGFGNLMSFFAIGIVCYFLAYMFSLEQYELTSIVMTLLYLTGPVGLIMGNIQSIARAKVPIDMYHQALNDLRSEDDYASRDFKNEYTKQWRFIEVKDLTYQYPSASSDMEISGVSSKLPRYGLGPINITINRSQITFIVGGNGSGKTTLGKLLCLLYLPSDGSIFFDDVEVDKKNITSFRESISAIYTDYYLFNKIVGVCDEDVDLKATQYLADLQLDKKVRISNGVFSTTDLSDGQRKRLALLVAFLENREIYIFDEWAADQDPEFKKVFYEKILPQLKAKGKAVIVITHDDRYFSIADKIIKMENGSVVEINEKTIDYSLIEVS